MHSEMRTVRAAHLSLLMTVPSFSTQYNTEQFWLSPLLPPDKHHSSDVVCWRRGGVLYVNVLFVWMDSEGWYSNTGQPGCSNSGLLHHRSCHAARRHTACCV